MRFKKLELEKKIYFTIQKTKIKNHDFGIYFFI